VNGLLFYFTQGQRRPDTQGQRRPEQGQRRPDADVEMAPTPLFWALAAAALASVLIQCRPPASDFAEEVEYRRQVKKDLAAGRRPRPRSAKPKAAAAQGEDAADSDDLGSASMFGLRRWDGGLWAADAGIASLGCTPKGCLIGFATLWWRPPSWPRDYDVYMLAALHAYSAFCPTDVYFRNFAPRLRRPHTVLLGAVATRSIWELMWVGSTLLGLGTELQKALGRGGFLALYLGAGEAFELTPPCAQTALLTIGSSATRGSHLKVLCAPK